MKKIFLTSSPTGDLDGRFRCDGIDYRNGFCDRLKENWRPDSRCLMITAFPEDHVASEEMTAFFHRALQTSGFSVSAMDLWDDRITVPVVNDPMRGLSSYDVIFLGGGHVPTQNRFFQMLGLRNALEHYQGIVIGISAGSMNSADLVYAQPELEGEAVDPGYQRFLPGLNLTKINILPHYQMTKDMMLDGKRLYEEITLPDSDGKTFLVIPDGSYLVSIDGVETVYGDAWRIRDRHMEKICRDGESMIL